MTLVAGWGRYPTCRTELLAPTSLLEARATAGREGLIARGNGRAYGDAAIGDLQTLSMVALDRIQAFDPAALTVTVEAGLQLADLITAMLPRGLFPFVVPGTRFVTVGGAIAADVHGKNHHHEGGFGAFVERLTLLVPDGTLIEASRETHADLFHATIGGMGLTGTIVSATLRLRPVETGWIRQDTIVAHDLASTFRALDDTDASTFSVAWIDCNARGARLGRSLVFAGEHASRADVDQARGPGTSMAGKPRLSVPTDLPGATLNRFSVAAFNELYFQNGRRSAGRPTLKTAESYFFPLDGIGDWNRIYGRRGFLQHQSVLPLEVAPAILADMLGRIAARGAASFLSVLKKLGRGGGLMSFPFPGYTLALDFAMGPGILAFLDELDELVVRGGGRLYLAKDARQSRATFEAGYGDRLARFRDIRHAIDPGRRLRSRQSQRLGL